MRLPKTVWFAVAFLVGIAGAQMITNVLVWNEPITALMWGMMMVGLVLVLAGGDPYRRA